MKKLFCHFFVLLALALCFAACDNGGDDFDKWASDTAQKPYTNTGTNVMIVLDDNVLWKANKFSTCYAKIPTNDNPQWFDILFMAEENQLTSSSICADNYLFIHTDMPQTKDFCFDTIRSFSTGLKIIYSEGKHIEDAHVTYAKYLTNPKGILTINHNDGKNMSGVFDGTITDIMKSTTHTVKIVFNNVPISLVK